MNESDDLHPIEITNTTGIEVTLDPLAELGAVMDDLEALLKSGEVIGALTNKGVNASLTLVAVQGLRNYLANRKPEAADDFGTVTDEIRARLEAKARGELP